LPCACLDHHEPESFEVDIIISNVKQSRSFYGYQFDKKEASIQMKWCSKRKNRKHLWDGQDKKYQSKGNQACSTELFCCAAAACGHRFWTAANQAAAMAGSFAFCSVKLYEMLKAWNHKQFTLPARMALTHLVAVNRASDVSYITKQLDTDHAK